MDCRRCEPVPEEVRRAADLLERRWLLSVLYAALAGALRFNEVSPALEGVAPPALPDPVRELGGPRGRGARPAPAGGRAGRSPGPASPAAAHGGRGGVVSRHAGRGPG